MRGRNRVGGDVYWGPDFPSLPGLFSRWVVLAIALITGITRWSHHTTHLERNVQIFHFYTNPWCSLVIFYLLIGFIWSPSCFSFLSLPLSFPQGLIPPSLSGWQAEAVSSHPAQTWARHFTCITPWSNLLSFCNFFFLQNFENNPHT